MSPSILNGYVGVIELTRLTFFLPHLQLLSNVLRRRGLLLPVGCHVVEVRQRLLPERDFHLAGHDVGRRRRQNAGQLLLLHGGVQGAVEHGLKIFFIISLLLTFLRLVFQPLFSVKTGFL